ncbi:PREDICTED: tyrosine-protein kinase receptor Tie-1-like [Acropora digitifera]|uniref:tyrosine-protein kinase receptor Tie-1-like n=1 Tax=Acropora digitifera TaxID=70779 RepID=UPI00077AC675|nr:PREDICTED: tyrosine-protein kinase receptor Tie-1-like [Acropora digitifera]
MLILPILYNQTLIDMLILQTDAYFLCVLRWSFGVVLFEIVTIGGSPYPVMESLELIDRLESGYRMEKPHHITDELYSIMLSCWIDDPNMRPSFAQLHTTLGQLATKDKDCIDLRTYKRKLYEKIQTPEDRKQILT